MGVHNKDLTHCRKGGHPLTGDNLYRNPAGYRICRTCARLKRQREAAATPLPPATFEIEDALHTRNAILNDIRTAMKQYRPLKPAKSDNDLLLVLEPVDAHLGALGWSEETGEPHYDLGIAARLYRQAVEGLLARAARDKPGRIILRVGDDLVHVNGPENMTANGTPQDADGRFAKVFRTAVSVVAHAARRCAELAPTEVVVVPGNHDTQSTFALGEVLGAMFADHPYVNVSPVLTPRQYIEHGCVLLCFAHGHNETPASLPLLMAAEAPAAWARTRQREVHLGHLHRKRALQSDEHCGVRVRWLPSFKSADEWHASKGFVGATRATEAYLYSASRGFLGVLSEPVVA